MKKFIQLMANTFGYKIERMGIVDSVIEQDSEFMKIYEKCKDYTMTSIENMYQLYLSVKYVINKGIKGDFVECGVWKGGSVMVIASTLLNLGIENRKIWLYDTFEGMSKPTNFDVTINGGEKPTLDNDYDNCFSSLEEVKENLVKIEYPFWNYIFTKGKVEDTIPKNIPSSISLLRLDTDWYVSTKHELNFLYPLLQERGVLIIDDYGTWKGAKKAVDEYFKDKPVLLNRIDGTARLVIK